MRLSLDLLLQFQAQGTDTLFNVQELVERGVAELTSRGAEVQVTLLWAALLGTKLQKPR